MRKSFLTIYVGAGLIALQAMAAHASDQDEALADYTLEQLSNVVVTSVSRQETRLANAPASVYVITGSDIARSGAAALPEALRLAPNLQVARRDASGYAISARGFSTTLSNKMLVLIDGRSVYSPLFSGVFWESQDVTLSDVERIEVISGPGGTVWGANAVNGVINIITKSARDTQGGLLNAGAGTYQRGGAVRYGGQLGEGSWYRAYAKVTYDEDAMDPARGHAQVGWRRSQAGFRIDSEGQGRTVTVSGDVYDGRFGQARAGDIVTAGANLLGRVTRQLDRGGELKVQAYIDQTRRDQPAAAQRLSTFDLEVQHALPIGQRHHLAWGGGYRYSLDRMTNGPQLIFIPAERHLQWSNLFVQDEVAITTALRATVGVKLEHNVYSGSETMPSLRLAWNATPASMLWAGASRAVRAPARIDRDVMQLAPGRTSGPPWAVAGGPDFDSESARVLELGYRAQFDSKLSWSATAFASHYDGLRTLEPGTGQGALFQNLGKGRVRGIELWGAWQPLPSWRLSAGGVVQDVEFSLKPGSSDLARQTSLASNDPHSYWSVKSSHDLPGNLRADLSLRHVGQLPNPVVPAYTELDARLAWPASGRVELALVGRNLLHSTHAEFGDARTRQVFARSVMLTAAVRF
ncbi:TonB-dependent receptor plug domain-containing protein [Massilia agilis]|nr:TonB-dependent receptor [Massilia agilis]